MSFAVITIESHIAAPVDVVWACWTTPADVMQWNHASDDWYCPAASNDLRVGGRFVYAMAARDGSVSFDFEGTYDDVVPHARIAYTMPDGRRVVTTFTSEGSGTHVRTDFDAETLHSEELQRQGWQSILDNFKRLAESRIAP